MEKLLKIDRRPVSINVDSFVACLHLSLINMFRARKLGLLLHM